MLESAEVLMILPSWVARRLKEDNQAQSCSRKATELPFLGAVDLGLLL